MYNGWIKLHRSLTEWGWYQDANTARVFLHLLLTANHAPKEWRGITIQPGQVIASRKKLATSLRITERAVRTALDHLRDTGEISTSKTTSKTTKAITLITIEKWALYQMEEEKTTSKTTSKTTTNRPATDQQPTTNKKEKKEKKKIIKRDIREISALSKDHNAYKAIKEKLKGGII